MIRTFTTVVAGLFLLMMSISSAAALNEAPSACPSGDAYFLQYLGEKDEVMRVEDYKNFYEPLKKLSSAGFCVHLNWSASVRDLRRALQNTRPTIIIWSSHGQPRGITDKDDDETLLPPDIFQNVSPTVFQFVVATCFGSPAIKNYDLTKAGSIKFTGWDFPLSTEYFRKFLETWDFLENYPAKFTHDGLSCVKEKEDHLLINIKDKKILGRYRDRKDCFNHWASASQGLVCATENEKNLLYDITAGKIVKDSAFGRFAEWCLETPERIHHQKVCYMAEKKSSVYEGKQYYEMYYGIYDLQKHEATGLEFSQKSECTKFLWSPKLR